MKRTILAFIFLALVGTAPALMAQDVEREQQRREEAEHQLQEALAQLELAIPQLLFDFFARRDVRCRAQHLIGHAVLVDQG